MDRILAAHQQMTEESEIAAASAELKPGERKVISDGTEGPVVEIIRKTETEQPAESDAAEAAEAEDLEIKKPTDETDAEVAGE